MALQEKKPQVLIFCSREICYLSGNFFANQLAAAFEELGFTAELCEFVKEGDMDAQLEPFIGRPYRAVVDFNSLLPRMVMEDGTAYLDMLSGPFFDYILDHPLFHYNCLTSGAENLHVLVLDRAQRDYVERWYPQVKSARFLPLGATEALYVGKKLPADHIFFPGTYDAPNAVYGLVEASPEPFLGIMKEMIERRMEDPLLPMEEAFAGYLRDHGEDPAEVPFALYMNAMYPVDAYVRDAFRKKALDALLLAGIPVTVCGNGWEKYRAPREALFERQKEVPFALSFEKIAHEQVLLNISPIFGRGMHDRVAAGMANRAAVLTDRNPYLEQEFSDGENISLYSLRDLDTLCGRAAMLLENQDLREAIQQNGYKEFCERHTWRRRAEQILAYGEEEAAKTDAAYA